MRSHIRRKVRLVALHLGHAEVKGDGVMLEIRHWSGVKYLNQEENVIQV